MKRPYRGIFPEVPATFTESGDANKGPWDGEEGITRLPDLDAGATACMSGGGYPDGLRQITGAYLAGRPDEAVAAYEKSAVCSRAY